MSKPLFVRALAALALVVVGWAAIATNALSAPVEKIESVLVTNDPSTPVPTAPQGTTQVAGTVGIDATANQVRLAPAGELVQASQSMAIAPDETLLQQTLLDVPAGKRFIAQQVNGETVTTDTGSIRIQVSGTGTPTFRVPVTPSHGDQSGLKRSQFNEEMHFFVDGPGQVRATIFRNDPAIGAVTSHPVTIVGMLVDCASCS